MKRLLKLGLVLFVIYLVWRWWAGASQALPILTSSITAISVPGSEAQLAVTTAQLSPAALAGLWEPTPSWVGIAQPVPGSAVLPGFGPSLLQEPRGGSVDQAQIQTNWGDFSAAAPSPAFLGVDSWGAAGAWLCAERNAYGTGCPIIRRSVL